MTYANATKQYAAYTAAHHNVNKTRQVVMLYDGAIRFVQQAKDAILRKDIQGRFNALEKASAIVTGLQAALDHQTGGRIAKLLDDYYFSIYMRLMNVHNTNDPITCDQVTKELRMMREAWEEVDRKTTDTSPLTGTGGGGGTSDISSGMHITPSNEDRIAASIPLIASSLQVSV